MILRSDVTVERQPTSTWITGRARHGRGAGPRAVCAAGARGAAGAVPVRARRRPGGRRGGGPGPVLAGAGPAAGGGRGHRAAASAAADAVDGAAATRRRRSSRCGRRTAATAWRAAELADAPARIAAALRRVPRRRGPACRRKATFMTPRRHEGGFPDNHRGRAPGRSAATTAGVALVVAPLLGELTADQVRLLAEHRADGRRHAVAHRRAARAPPPRRGAGRRGTARRAGSGRRRQRLRGAAGLREGPRRRPGRRARRARPASAAAACTSPAAHAAAERPAPRTSTPSRSPGAGTSSTACPARDWRRDAQLRPRRRRDLPPLVRHHPRRGRPHGPAAGRRPGRRPDDPRLRAGRPRRRPRLLPRRRRSRPRTALQNGAPILCDAQMVASGVTRARLPAGNDVVCTCATRGSPRSRRGSAPPAAPPRSSCGATGSTARSSRSATPRRRCSTCSTCSTPARPGRPRSSASRSGSSGRRSRRRRWRRPTWSTSSSTAAAAAPRSRRRRSTRSRARRRAETAAASCDDGTAVRRRRRPRRPRARHGQGRPPDPRRRRDRLPLGPARPLDRPRASPRRTCAAARSRRRWSTRSPPRPPTTPAATRARSTSSTPTPRERLAAHLDAGRDVVVLAEGDPLFYGSYMHMHKRLAHRYPTEVVPGVTSISAASAALGQPLVERDEVLTVLPGTLPPRRAGPPARRHRLRGRPEARPDLRHRPRRRGRRRPRPASTSSAPRWTASAPPRSPTSTPPRCPTSRSPCSRPGAASLRDPRRPSPEPPPRRPGREPADAGEVVVVGTGPAGRDWLTPQVAAVLAAADDLVGYGPYLARVPPNPRQARHASDNRVEADRAAHALDLAAAGRWVAVVSGGDPGVFAMAAAVLEVAAQDEVRRRPGARAARA